MDELINELESIGIDAPAALARFGGNWDMFLKFLFQFPEERSFAEYRGYIGQGDNAMTEESIHTLKGVAGNLGLDRLFDISSKLLTMIRKEELAQLDEVNKELFEEYDRVAAEIKELQAQY